MCLIGLAFLSVCKTRRVAKVVDAGQERPYSAVTETAFGVFALWRKGYAGRILDREPERILRK